VTLVEALAGPVVVAAALVALAGGMKVRQPAATAGALRALRLPSSFALVRVLGAGEVVVAVAAAATFARPLLVLLAATYLGFAAFVVAALDAEAPLQSCGCFGRADTPPSAVHLGLNLCAAGTLFAAALTGTPGLGTIVPDQPWSAVPFVPLIGVCTYLCVIVLTLLPMTLRSSATT